MAPSFSGQFPTRNERKRLTPPGLQVRARRGRDSGRRARAGRAGGAGYRRGGHGGRCGTGGRCGLPQPSSRPIGATQRHAGQSPALGELRSSERGHRVHRVGGAAARIRRPQQRQQRRPQPILVEGAQHAAALDQARRGGLLADHDRDRVGLLADPDRGAVARAVALAVDGRLGKRQHDAGRQDPVAADEHGAVVQRGVRREDRLEQLLREVGVEHDPGLGRILEAGLPLDDDERADPVCRQRRSRARDDGRDALGVGCTRRRHHPAQGADAPDSLQGAPQLRLEDDHERQEADHGAGLEDRGEQPQVERLGDHVHAVEQDRADDEPDGAGPLDQAEQPVDQESGEGDIEH